LDPVNVDPLIRKLGGKMLGKDWQTAEEAARKLSLIDDPRVVPWYVKAMDTDDYDLKCMALDRLGRFNSDAALEGIGRAFRPRDDDKEGDKNRNVPSGDRSLDKNIRQFAAEALLRSPRPDAQRLLLTLWNDPDREVRSIVLEALNKMRTKESLDLLEKMIRDSDEGVRSQALESLQSRTKKSGAGD
jgi:HEAT repeat protein